jgi:hypothetical protein
LIAGRLSEMKTRRSAWSIEIVMVVEPLSVTIQPQKV